MGIAERREREREALRTRIVEAARDIVSEEGLDALSMRAIAERIEYSPATLYLYFRDKEELLREVVGEGFRRLGECSRAEMEAAPPAGPAGKHRALGRAYARFALENTAYFRVMFELPTVPRLHCPVGHAAAEAVRNPDQSFCALVDAVQRSIDAGTLHSADARRTAVISWGLIHGLVSLYLSGHLAEVARTPEELMGLVEEAMDSIGSGWSTKRGGETGAPHPA